MDTIGSILEAVGGITMLVCFILVLVQMFQHGKTGMGVLCIVLALCCGLGGVVAFIYGWVKSAEWNLRNVMLAWTAGFVLSVVGGIMNPTQFQQLQQLQQLQGR